MHRPVLTIALPLIVVSAVAPVPSTAREAAAAGLGTQQQALFAKRLDGLSDRIDRQQRAGLLSVGQAAFMQQDLARVWDSIGMILRRSATLSPQEQASYGAMVRRVEIRLVQAEARRGATPHSAR